METKGVSGGTLAEGSEQVAREVLGWMWHLPLAALGQSVKLGVPSGTCALGTLWAPPLQHRLPKLMY